MRLNKLKLLYMSAGYTQRSFAKEIGITPQYLWAIENNKFKPSLNVIMRMSQVLELDINELQEFF